MVNSDVRNYQLPVHVGDGVDEIMVLTRNVIISKDGVNENSTCNHYIQMFAGDVADFTKCTVENARPIRICERCIVQYASAIDTFDILMVNKIAISQLYL